MQALSHPYVAYHHDEADEPSCPQVFDRWEQVEGLTTIEELREAISREIEEYRAEVRNVDTWSTSDDEADGGSGSEEEQEVLVDDTEHTITATPHPTVPGPTPASGSASTSPSIQQRELGLGSSPKTSTHMLPPISRTRSRGRGYTPQSPALDESNANNEGGYGTMPNGAPISRTSSRRASGHSMTGRRPASFLFSPFGSGMTPLPSMISSQSQGSNLPSSSTASGSGSTAVPSMGHGHSASVDYYSGRRSRAPSTTGDYSLRPLIRQLSTVGMGVGGDDGVPVAGAESSKAGLGLDGVSIPIPNVRTNEAGAAGGDDGLPPMKVSPSDEPASTVSIRLWGPTRPG